MRMDRMRENRMCGRGGFGHVFPGAAKRFRWFLGNRGISGRSVGTVDGLVDEKPYLETSVFSLAKNRILWLLILMVSSMITGGILGKYEDAFAAFPLLVTFIPMLTDTGGNAGSQSSTLVIRGMAVGEIESGDIFRVFLKELCVGMIVGVILGAVNYVQLILRFPGNEAVCFTVVLSLFLTVTLAKTVGGILPVAARLLNLDPAIMAAPLITTIVDGFSLMIYFRIACRMLKLG